TLEYGKGQALYSVSRQNTNQPGSISIITRLYAYGSNRNIDINYRGGVKYLRMAANTYIEKNVAQLGLFASIVYFDGQSLTPEIYPHRVGTVTAVTADFTFADADIDF